MWSSFCVSGLLSGSFVFLDIGEAMGFVSVLSCFYAPGSLFTCYSHLGY